MPELPEVETVRRGLEPVLVGSTLARVEQRRADLRFPLPERFAARLKGHSVEALERRAKYLLAHLSGGEVLVMHLGMTGRFTILAPNGAKVASAQEPGNFAHGTVAKLKHDHIVFHTDSGATVTYNDPRRFGYMLLVPASELLQHPLMRSLGVEPLGPELTPDYLARRAFGRKVDLKAFLSDQRIIAGLGNIYVCEALYRARLAPARPAASLATKTGRATERARRLVAAVRAVLADAIAAGGSSLRDYRHADGSLGTFQHAFAVYDREEWPCPTTGCGISVRRIVQSGRSTFYCPKCQR
jgi:formamidopyrimidine-DNA glycosylase